MAVTVSLEPNVIVCISAGYSCKLGSKVSFALIIGKSHFIACSVSESLLGSFTENAISEDVLAASCKLEELFRFFFQTVMTLIFRAIIK